MKTKPLKTLTSEQSNALLQELIKHRDTDHSRRTATRTTSSHYSRSMQASESARSSSCKSGTS